MIRKPSYQPIGNGAPPPVPAHLEEEHPHRPDRPGLRRPTLTLAGAGEAAASLAATPGAATPGAATAPATERIRAAAGLEDPHQPPSGSSSTAATATSGRR
ncbi:hypothetical protein ACFQ2B_05055 [Streptomyces stramineus]